MRICATDMPTKVTHIIPLQPCCPASGNPLEGSTVMISYNPVGIVMPVEDLEVMCREYAGGLGSIRGMEEMIQDIARRCALVIRGPVSACSRLLIQPPYGGASQQMIVECECDFQATDTPKQPRRCYTAPEGECAYCDRLVREDITFAPPHDASPNCQSGGHNHCTCDTCF